MSLDELKPGDDVIISSGGLSTCSSLRPVERVTRTQVVVRVPYGNATKERRFYKDSGRELGDYRCRIRVATDKDRADITTAKNLARLKGLKFDTLTPETVAAMLKAHDEGSL